MGSFTEREPHAGRRLRQASGTCLGVLYDERSGYYFPEIQRNAGVNGKRSRMLKISCRCLHLCVLITGINKGGTAEPSVPDRD